jgi:N-hydroxyarylamine O-acetyltransferase
MDPNDRLLGDALTERVLARLGFASRPAADAAGLHDLYSRWCRAVPFDDLRKLIHLDRDARPLDRGDARLLPGDDVTDYFESWLAWGCGGTCWAGNGALAMLLRTLGFDAVRGLATMLVAPDLPPNHGTVVVTLDGERLLVDASMLFGKPLLLDEEHETAIEHGAWGVRCARRDGHFVVAWKPIHAPQGLECRIDRLSATTAADFRDFHEKTREWSPFNFSAYARLQKGDAMLGIAFGNKVRFGPDGCVESVPVDRKERDRFLVEEIGIHAELVEKVPDDRPLPSPPKR